MALDEHRKPFNTTMWHYPTEHKATGATSNATSTELRAKWEKLRDTDSIEEPILKKAWEDLVDAEMREELKGSNSELLQVWFPGYHINIGGGSDDLLKKKEGDFERKRIRFTLPH